MDHQETIVITHERDIDMQLRYLKRLLKEKGWLKIQVSGGGTAPKQRTPTQNRCFHQYCEDLAWALRDAGHEDIRTLIKVPITPNKDYVKHEMCHPVMFAMFPHRKSSSELTTKEMCDFYDQMNLFTSERLGISVPWPNRDEHKV